MLLLINFVQAEQDRTSLTKRVQEIEASLHKKEELRLTATVKLERATELADDAQRFINSSLIKKILKKIHIVTANLDEHTAHKHSME